MKNNRSLQSSIRLFCIYFFLFCVAVLLLISVLFARNKKQDELHAGRDELESYYYSFESTLKSHEKFNLEYLTNDSDINVLSLSHYSGPSRHSLVYTVSQGLAMRSTSYSFNILYDSRNDQIFTTPLTVSSPDSSVDDSVILRAIVSFADSLEETMHGRWNIYSYNGRYFLVLCNRKNRLLLTTVFSVNDYFNHLPLMSDSENVHILLCSDDCILNDNGADLDADTVSYILSSAGETETLHTSSKGILVSRSAPPSGLNLYLCKLSPRTDFIKGFSSLLVASFSLLAIFLAFSALSYRYLHHFLVFPLREIETISTLAERGEPLIPSEKPLPREYGEIRQSLYILAGKLEHEQRERQDNLYAKEHALLQYYQLQTRSHFFINCLKTLYSMIELHRDEQMKSMIIAFSNHLRNTFQDCLQLIPLRQELDEVSVYHTILLLDNSRPFLLNISVPESLKSVMVPPLVIQSFLENTRKHSAPGDSMIVFTVRADTVTENGKEYLQLHLSDNGIGYSKDRMAELNKAPSGSFDTNNVGINNLKRRINLLFHGEGHTAFVNLPYGGACAIVSFPVIYDTDDKGGLK